MADELKLLSIVHTDETAAGHVSPLDPKAHQTIRKSANSSADLLPAISKLADRIGHADFYEVALELMGRLIRCDRRLIMRYSKFDKPSFLVNKSLQEDFVASYLDGLYRFDPLYRAVRSKETAGVLTFQQLRDDQPVDNFYNEFFASVIISDELSIMLPAVGGVCIALCFDNERQAFQNAETFRARQVYPVIEALHRLHVEKSMFWSRNGSPIDSRMAMLIADADGHILYRNDMWTDLGWLFDESDLNSLTHAQSRGEHFVGSDHVLHWDTLPPSNAVAPDGRLYIIERTSPGHFNVNVQVIYKAFAERHRLTPREKEIVWLMLRGFPSYAIATKLGLTAGTVKNHRYRLYRRLDITTEREIFSLFLNDILSHH